MSRIECFGLFLILCCIPGPAQDHPEQAVPEGPLIVNARVIAQRYCHVDPEAFSVFMDVDLRFTNTTDQPVILSRHVEPGGARVARDVEAAKLGDFEVEPSGDYFPVTLPPVPKFGAAPDSKDFVVLAPHASYETRVSSGVIGILDAAKAKKGSGFIARGTHVLQIEVDLWPFGWPYFVGEVDAQKTSERWRAYGHLATGTIDTDFAPFTIPEKFPNPQCPQPKVKRR